MDGDPGPQGGIEEDRHKHSRSELPRKNTIPFCEFEKDKIDRISLCTNNLDKDDPDAYWEALAHEATHVMQACTENCYVLNDNYIARVYRELQAINPASFETIQEYGSWNRRQEIEARRMELQSPSFTIEMLREICKSANLQICKSVELQRGRLILSGGC